MDYYHFVKGATPRFHDNAARLRGLDKSPVHFETPLVGPWDSLTIIYDADLTTAQETIASLNSPIESEASAEDRPLGSTTAVETIQGPLRIRRSYHEEYEAYALITAIDPPDYELFHELEGLAGYTGSATPDKGQSSCRDLLSATSSEGRLGLGRQAQQGSPVARSLLRYEVAF